RLPSPMARRYCGMRIRPCESWPHRLASTRLPATIWASSPGTPPASNNARAKGRITSTAKVGTVRVPHKRCVGRRYGSRLVPFPDDEHVPAAGLAGELGRTLLAGTVADLQAVVFQLVNALVNGVLVRAFGEQDVDRFRCAGRVQLVGTLADLRAFLEGALV